MMSHPPCNTDNGGITLPDGFCAVVVADHVGAARHSVVTSGGDIYLALYAVRYGTPPGGIVGLRDTDGDGHADVEARLGATVGTGIELHDGFLYASSTTSVVRFRLQQGHLKPVEPPEIIVSDLPERDCTGEHPARPFTFDDNQFLYVHVGAPSNACQSVNRKPRVAGQDPCPDLERHAGIWRFHAATARQTQLVDGERIATGIRSSVGMEWHPTDRGLYVLVHGRDGLSEYWPELFTARQNADLPSDELLRVSDGSDFGWPYCYHDPVQNRRVLAPEYGGDGNRVNTYSLRFIRYLLGGIRCGQYSPPLLALPAHSAPNDLLVYSGTQFPARFRHGVFVARHGGWGRMPFEQRGYDVVFVPWNRGRPQGGWEVFATGFAGRQTVMKPNDATYRPMGLAEGPDGSLYVTDSVKGRIWRIIYTKDNVATAPSPSPS